MTGFAVACIGFFVLTLAEHFGIQTSKEATAYYTWVTGAFVLVIYFLLSILLGRKEADRLVNWIPDRIIRLFFLKKFKR